MLDKMKAELDAEASKEADMYDKMVCWCETNEKQKKRAVADADTKDGELTSEIASRSARVGKLSAEIKYTKEDIADNTESLDKSRTIREKDYAKFLDDEKETVQAVTNLRNAVRVLAKHQDSSMMQLDAPVLSGIRVMLRDAALKYEVLVAGRSENQQGEPQQPPSLLMLSTVRQRVTSHAQEGALTSSLMSALDAHGAPVADTFPLKFAEELVAKAAAPPRGARSFLQTTAAQPASGGIYGIITTMLENFEKELKEMRKEEATAAADFKELETTKESQIETAKAKLDDMETEAAANAKALSDAKEDLVVTRKQRSTDVEFLRNLKLTCSDLDRQWEKRSETRMAETKAVQEAIQILSEDSAREATFKATSFLQEAATRAGAASRAASVLRNAAQASTDDDDLLDAWHARSGPKKQGRGSRLSTLAMAVQLDSFKKVKEAIDKMVGELKAESADDVEKKDKCNKELREMDQQVFAVSDRKKDSEGKASRYESLADRLNDEIKDAMRQIAETRVDIKNASQSREEENKEFQSVVTDQRAAQPIIKKALKKLKDFYEKGVGKPTFLERSEQTPPVQFNDYKDSSGGSGVISMLEAIIADSEKLEKEVQEGELKAQLDYEKFVKDSNKLVNGLKDAVTSKTKALATAKSDLAETQSDVESAAEELEAVQKMQTDTHAECDWLLKNFDLRQKARGAEIESIQQAKAILSGSSSGR